MCLWSTQALAAKEWYEYYLAATEQQLPAGRWQAALVSLRAAQRLKPHSALQVQTYGLQFLDYLPNYYIGECYMRGENYQLAIQAFDAEEKSGLIRERPDLFEKLKRRRSQAQNEIASAERQEAAGRTRALVKGLLDAAADHESNKRYAEAQASLLEAKQADQSLREHQEEIDASLERVRAAENLAARQRHREQLMSEAQRLLDAHRDQEASGKFEEVLRLEPDYAPALEGKRLAAERIRDSTTRQQREARFKEGKDLYEAGRFEQAIEPLREAAADSSNQEAQALLEKALKLTASLKRQRELRLEIDRLLADGERLLAAGRYSAAQVKFQDVLELDPNHVHAKERLAVAERRSNTALVEQLLPNKPPILVFYEPGPSASAREVEAQTVALDGLAVDDRGIAKVEAFLDGRLVFEKTPSPRPGSGETQPSLPFRHVVALAPGPNELRVVATDILGITHAQSFRLTRRQRFYETITFRFSAIASALGLLALGLALQHLRQRRAIQRRFNPYIAGAPVTNDTLFFGRQKLLTRILNVLHHNSLIITGERRIGKTTLLLRLKKRLEVETRPEYQFFPVFTDLQGVTEELFFRTLMTDILEALQLSTRTTEACRYRPDAPAYDERDFSHDLLLVINELKQRTVKQAKLALLIDEVDVLNTYSERTNQRLRSIFMKTFAEHLVTVMSGVGIRRTWQSEGSPWYNFFDEIPLEPLAREEAEALIRNPVSGFFRYQSAAVEKILAYSERRPYVIQKLCVHAVNRMLENGRTLVTVEDVEAVRQSVLSEDGLAPLSAAG